MYYIDTNTLEYPLTKEEIIRRNPCTSFPVPFEPSEGYALVRPTTMQYNPDEGIMVEVAPEKVDDIWWARYVFQPFTEEELQSRFEEAKAALLTALTAKRLEEETGGLTLPNGVTIATGIADQDRITSVLVHSQAAGVSSVDFKATSGWVTLTIEEVQGIAIAIARHVQTCFSVERMHYDRIQALTTLYQIKAYNLTTDWP